MLDRHDQRGNTARNAFLILLWIVGVLVLVILVFEWLM